MTLNSPCISLAAQSRFLEVNSETYEILVKKIQMSASAKAAESVLNEVISAARFAVRHHTGRFVDGAIENLALKIGIDLGTGVKTDDNSMCAVPRKDNRRRILHVATSALAIGGHTRMLNNWMRTDKESSHSLALIDQGVVPIPGWLAQTIRSGGGNLVVFSDGLLCQKAKWLREMAKRDADLVVLHHYGFDIVPTVAFAVDECPPVALLNHADHEFWVGGTVSDIVINLRTAGAQHTARRRYLYSNAVLPIPLSMPKELSRSNARQALGIPEDQMVLLSISRNVKFRPCGPYDFVSTAGRILDRLPKAHFYVVGESPEGIAPYLRCTLHERLHFLGSVDDPSLYRAAADVYLESFPFGGQTALLESALNGLPVVPAYAPLFGLLVAKDDALEDLMINPRNEQEYIDQAELLIRQSDQRKEMGEKLRDRLLVDHVGEGWLNRLTLLYRQTDCLRHRPDSLPTLSCNIEDEDIGLCLWHSMSDAENYAMSTSTGVTPAVLYHTACLAKGIGEYSRARRFAWRTVKHNPHCLLSWRLLLITLLGKWGRLLRQAISSIHRASIHSLTVRS